MSHVLEKTEEELPVVTIYEEDLANCSAYQACLTTNEYGSTYLDPENCKARNFDSVKTSQENLDMLYLNDKLLDKIEEVKVDAVQGEMKIAIYDSMLPSCIPRFPKTTIVERLSEQHRSAIDGAIRLIDREVNFGDDRVKVTAVRVTKNQVFLDVEEFLTEGWVHLEIDYEEFLLLQKD